MTARDGSRSLVPQVNSLWLMSDSANVMFAAARRRCYIQNIPKPKEPAIRPLADTADAWEVLDEMEGRVPPPRVPQQAEGWKPWMPSGMQPVLEELPKWKILLEILDEIENTMSSNTAPLCEFNPGIIPRMDPELALSHAWIQRYAHHGSGSTDLHIDQRPIVIPSLRPFIA